MPESCSVTKFINAYISYRFYTVDHKKQQFLWLKLWHMLTGFNNSFLFHVTFLRSTVTMCNSWVVELLKSVYSCQSYQKNKSGRSTFVDNSAYNSIVSTITLTNVNRTFTLFTFLLELYLPHLPKYVLLAVYTQKGEPGWPQSRRKKFPEFSRLFQSHKLAFR